MKLGKFRMLALSAIVCLSSLASCGEEKNTDPSTTTTEVSTTTDTTTTSNTSQEEEEPYAKVTLTEAGAARINAAIERQQRARQKYDKYSNWLSVKYAAPLPKRAANPGDEVEEDMNFEIYPSDFTALDSLFLVGRTNMSRITQQSLTVGSGNSLVEITTNIPAEEISRYSLNGTVSYINGSANINHDTLEENNIPYQENTELTMTYTYIKKGTAATTSPYSCQPSFYITKVDNDAPESTIDELVFSERYTITLDELKSSFISLINDTFTVKDESLEKTVTINLTDSELQASMTDSINAAKADTTEHKFTPIDIPFTVSTVNASTDVLHAQLNFTDDILPEVWKNGKPVSEINLNGGVSKLPHRDTIKSGINQLLTANGYEVIDEINGPCEINFDVDTSIRPEDSDYYAINGIDKVVGLKLFFSKNHNNIEYIDQTTQFSFRPCYPIGSREYFPAQVIWYNDVSVGTYYFYYYGETPGLFLTNSVKDNSNNGLYVFEDLILNNNNNNNFYEHIPLDYVYLDSAFLYAENVTIIINSSVAFKGWDNIPMSRTSSIAAIYINTDNFEDKSKIDTVFENMPPVIPAENVYLSSENYDTENWYYSTDNRYTTCFGFKILNGTLDKVHFGYSADQFKAERHIRY